MLSSIGVASLSRSQASSPGAVCGSRSNTNNKMSRFEGVIQVHRLMRTSNFLGAVREITRVLPNVSDVRLAVQLLHLRSGCFDKLDRYHEALVDCRRASLLDPTHADVYARRGYICNKLGWHHQAIDAFTSALNCGVPEESFLNNRGFARHHIGQYWEAISDFTAVIEHNPSHGFAYGNRGMSFYKLGRRAAAEEDFVRSIELLTHDIQAYIDNSYSLVKRGMCFLMIGKYAEAEEDFLAAVRKRPSLPDAAASLGVLYRRQGRVAEAEREIAKAIALNPLVTNRITKELLDESTMPSSAPIRL